MNQNTKNCHFCNNEATYFVGNYSLPVCKSHGDAWCEGAQHSVAVNRQRYVQNICNNDPNLTVDEARKIACEQIK